MPIRYYCARCGQEQRPGEAFCSKCGKPVYEMPHVHTLKANEPPRPRTGDVPEPTSPSTAGLPLSSAARKFGAALIIGIILLAVVGNVVQGTNTPDRTAHKESERVATGSKGPEVRSDGSGQQVKPKDSLKANHAKVTGQPHKPDQEAPPPPRPKDRLANLGVVVTVSYVVDGDTIDVTPTVYGREGIRLIGVDTPESSQPYAEEASDFTRGRLEGHQVALEFDAQRIDSYNRVLAYVYLPEGTMFNETLIQKGYAQVYTVPPNMIYQERFLSAQHEAKAAGRGLWGLSASELCHLTDRGNGIGEGSGIGQGSASCAASPSATSTASATASASGGVPPISQTDCPLSAPIKGNENSGIYHTRASATYDETYPEVCFATEAAAQAAGYRAARD